MGFFRRTGRHADASGSPGGAGAGAGRSALDDDGFNDGRPDGDGVRGGLGRVAGVLGDGLLPLAAVTVLVVLLVLLYLWNGLLVLIHPGEAGALYRPFHGGTVTDYVYPEGLHILKPWNRMYVYDVRVQTVRQDLRVLTNKGLPISLSLSIRFYPEYDLVGLLHQRVGPDYVQKIVVPEVESVLRRNIGRHDPEDVYTNKEGILTNIVVKAIEEAGQKFVFIDDVIIRSVTLPEEVHAAIAEKLVQQQRWKAYEFRLAREQQEAERKRIESRGIRDFQTNVQATLTPDILRFHGVMATLDLARSANSKMIVIGGGDGGLPVILNPGSDDPAATLPALGSCGVVPAGTPPGPGADPGASPVIPSTSASVLPAARLAGP